MAHAKQGKSQRKRLQRQLEFYLSESNLRQDKFLQQAMDNQGFVPVRVFLSFNRLKTLKATERMILDEAEKSAAIRVDRARACIAPKALPAVGQDDEADTRTIYIDSFSSTDNHDSLRRTFSKFGKVNLVSLPRFSQSKMFKGFGFVEFSEQTAADEAVKASTDVDLRGIRIMSKTRWLEMKEQLKEKLSSSTSASVSGDIQDSGKDRDDGLNGVKSSSPENTDGNKKRKRRRNPPADHIHFGNDDREGDERDEPHSLLSTEKDKQQKKQKR